MSKINDIVSYVSNWKENKYLNFSKEALIYYNLHLHLWAVFVLKKV